MDKVEAVLLVQPLRFIVFDDEFYIWHNPVGLDGTDIVSNDLRAWVFSRLNVSDDGEREPGKNVVYSAMSRAQMPVPVPRSRIFCGFLIGALWSSLFVVRSQLESVRRFRNVSCGWFSHVVRLLMIRTCARREQDEHTKSMRSCPSSSLGILSRLAALHQVSWLRYQ